jgi:hypothetical protein
MAERCAESEDEGCDEWGTEVAFTEHGIIRFGFHWFGILFDELVLFHKEAL